MKLTPIVDQLFSQATFGTFFSFLLYYLFVEKPKQPLRKKCINFLIYIRKLKIYQINCLIIVKKILVYKQREGYALVH